MFLGIFSWIFLPPFILKKINKLEIEGLCSIQPLSIGKLNAFDHFKLMKHECQKYQFLCMPIASGQVTKHKFPTYIASWPLGPITMSITLGQVNNT